VGRDFQQHQKRLIQLQSCKGRPRFCPKKPLRRRSTTDCKPESIASHAASEHALSYTREERMDAAGTSAGG